MTTLQPVAKTLPPGRVLPCSNQARSLEAALHRGYEDIRVIKALDSSSM